MRSRSPDEVSGDRSRRDFDRIYATHHARLHHRVQRLVAPGDVDDIVANTFLAAWLRMSSLPTSDDAMSAWLLRAARFSAANLHRSRRRQLSIAERLNREHSRSSDPEPPDGTDPRLQEINGWHELSQTDRRLLEAVAFHGANTRELAELLGCSAAAARTRLSRARGRLRSLQANT